MSLFSGLSTFPITPFHNGQLDQKAFTRLLARCLEAKVDSLGILGSTGCYAYLSPSVRREVTQLALQTVGSQVPIFVSIGATSLKDVLCVAEDAQQLGARALLLPAVSYFPLREEEVFHLFEQVSTHVSVPLIVYDTPGTTQFQFSKELLLRICELPYVQAIKFPSGFPSPDQALQRFDSLKSDLPNHITLGVSGDPQASAFLRKGAQCWYSEWGGIFPQLARRLTDASLSNQTEEIQRLTSLFTPLWDLSDKYGGSLRVIASVASILGLTSEDPLPQPLLGVCVEDKVKLKEIISRSDYA